MIGSAGKNRIVFRVNNPANIAAATPMTVGGTFFGHIEAGRLECGFSTSEHAAPAEGAWTQGALAGDHAWSCTLNAPAAGTWWLWVRSKDFTFCLSRAGKFTTA